MDVERIDWETLGHLRKKPMRDGGKWVSGLLRDFGVPELRDE